MRAQRLTARDLSGCEHRTALDSQRRREGVVPTQAASAVRRIEAASLHRTRVRDLLSAYHLDSWLDLDSLELASPEQRQAETMAAITRRVRWIWRPSLPAGRGGAMGAPDALVAVDGGYVPVIVVNHRTSQVLSDGVIGRGEGPRPITSPLWSWLPVDDPIRSLRPHRRDQLRLAHVRHILADAGVDGPAVGGCIGLDADCVVVVDLVAVEHEYRQSFDRRMAIAAGVLETAPSRIGECRSCRWWTTVCEPELMATHDVSLVVNGQQSEFLRANEINSVDQLAARIEPPPGWSGGNYGELNAIARAWLTGVSLVRRVEMPSIVRADVEVDVDMESHGEDGVYLWGTLMTDVTDPAVPVRYRPFVTWDPLPTKDEARVFAEFWSWLMKVRDEASASGKTFAAYCYSQSAENRWLRASATRFSGLAGVPSLAEVDAFIASDQWQDVFESVVRDFLSPLGKGLKVIAPVAGFQWQDPDAGGEASMDWYRHAVGITGPISVEQRERLLRYNSDDVWATKVLREWITDRAATEVISVGDLPSLQIDAASASDTSQRSKETSTSCQGDRT